MSSPPVKDAPEATEVQRRATVAFTRMVKDIEEQRNQAKRKAGRGLVVLVIVIAILIVLCGYQLITSLPSDDQSNFAQYIGNPISAFIGALLALAVREYRSHR